MNILSNDVALEQTFCMKYLGVYIDPNLKWTEHLYLISSTISKRNGVLNHVKKILHTKTLNLIVKSIISPLLITVIIIVWTNAAETHIQNIDKLLNRAGRIV